MIDVHAIAISRYSSIGPEISRMGRGCFWIVFTRDEFLEQVYLGHAPALLLRMGLVL